MAEIVALYGKTRAPAARISIAPWETIAAVLRICGYGVLLLSGWSLLRQRPRRRFFVAVLLICTAVQVLLAAVVSSLGRPFAGPFETPADFAAHLTLLLPLAFGALWAEVLTNADRGRASTDHDERLTERITPLVLRALVWLTLAAGIVAAMSRSATVSALAGTLLLVALALGRRRRLGDAPSKVALALGIGGLTATRAMALPALSAGAQPDRSIAIWRVSVDAWRAFPVTGAGFGAFADAFRRAQPRELGGLVENAHSDALQLLVTGGAVGVFLGLVAFFSLIVILVRRWRTQMHREESALALAGIGSLVSFGLHGLVAFNLGTPAIPATLACILGLTLASGSDSVAGPGSPPRP